MQRSQIDDAFGNWSLALIFILENLLHASEVALTIITIYLSIKCFCSRLF